jgi:hypothetical protein
MDCPTAVCTANNKRRIPTLIPARIQIKRTRSREEADGPTMPRAIRLPSKPRHGNHRTAADADKAMQGTRLLSPFFFIMRNGFLGVPYKNLSASKYLYNATAHVPLLLKRPKLNARIRVMVRQLSLRSCDAGTKCVYVSGQDMKRSTTNLGYLIRSLERTCPSPCRVSSSVSRMASIVSTW